jgi:hypothetical protein
MAVPANAQVAKETQQVFWFPSSRLGTRLGTKLRFVYKPTILKEN